MHRSPSSGIRPWAGLLALVLFGIASLPAGAGQTPLVQPNANTCSSGNPCYEWDNSAGGAGLKGTSAKGDAVVGLTKKSTGSHSGVLGRDVSVYGGNSGVHGDSVRGYGVLATSGDSTGLYATSPFTAISGISTGTDGSESVGVDAETTNGTAVLANGDTAVNATGYAVGVRAKSTSSLGDAFLATGGRYLFRANINGFDVFSVDGAGNVLGTGHAIFDTGLYAADASMAVSAQTSTQGGYVFYGADDFGNGVFSVDGFGVVFAHSFQTFDAPTIQQKTSTGTRVTAYSHESSSPTLEDFGEAQLIDGSTTVALDDTFASAIDRGAGYMVFVTPEGDTRGLYVTQKTPTGFVVRENQGGRSSVAFSYRIVAKPFGAVGTRLQRVPERKLPRLRPISPRHRQ